ncbi:MAG: hypothetical protein ACJ72N_10455 [Labedaea sp.]
MAILAVHGIGTQQLGRQQLVKAWAPALGDGLERALGRKVDPGPVLDIAFYGDVFLPMLPGTNKAGGHGEDVFAGLSDVEVEELAEEVAAELDPADQAAAREGVGKAYTRVPRPMQTVLRALDRRFGPSAGVLHIGVFRQVKKYLTEATLKARVDARVAQAAADCQVLLGHSLGSVVAYEYLRQHPHHRPAFITLGSPLGLRMVRERLPAGQPQVLEWTAVRDPRDPVACAGDLAGWWPGVRDRQVNNGNDAHSVLRYLSKKEAGHAIAGALSELT